MHVRAYAKINPYLDIIGKRKDGYHDLKIVFRPVSLYDDVDVQVISKKQYDSYKGFKANGLCFECSKKEFENDSNLVYKAHSELSKITKLPYLYVALKKNIPDGAGMGGGSSDAAAFMKAVNYLGDLDLDLSELEKIGSKIGADVPATLHTHPMIGEGIGDKLSPVLDGDIYYKNKEYYIIVKPSISFNTAYMYKTYDEVASLISKSNRKFYNVFEKVARERKLILGIKKILKDEGAKWSLLTGSGSCVIGAFADKKDRDKAYKNIKKKLLLKKSPYEIEAVLRAESVDEESLIHYAYIFECKDKTLYAGYTNDIKAREMAHNASSGGAKYTKAHGGGKIIYYETYDNKSDALSREAAIKKLSRENKLLLIKRGKFYVS